MTVPGHLVTVALLIMGIAAVLTRWRASHLAHRYGFRLLMPTSTAAVAAGTMLVAFGVSGSGTLDSILVLIGAMTFGVGYDGSLAMTIIASLARVPPDQVTAASTVWNFSIEAGMASAPACSRR